MIVNYQPILFPTAVGALSSTAAFEKTLTAGLGAGVKHRFKFKEINFKSEANMNYLQFFGEYDSKYGFLWILGLEPYWNWKGFEVGVNYNLTGGLVSLKEEKTGQSYPFKEIFYLQSFLFSLSKNF